LKKGERVTDIHTVISYSKDATLLYVEDNADTREMTTMLLEEFFESIVVAKDGEDGLEKFQANQIDMVLTDINMPKFNGIELCKKIRTIDKEVKLVLFSAQSKEDFSEEDLAVDVDGYLFKPLDMEQIMLLIVKLFHEKTES
jgi:CheY-like chemotaxis protein